MIQRFLLDRIDTKSAASAVGRQHHPIANSLTHKAKSALSFVQLAKPRTEPALDAALRQQDPPATRIVRLCQLSDHLSNIAQEIRACTPPARQPIHLPMINNQKLLYGS